MGIKYFYVDSPLYKLECTARVCNRYFSLQFKENSKNSGLTEGEYNILDTILRSPDITQIELARLLCKGRSHITQMLNTLEEKGLVTRINEVKNGRMVRRTVMTEKGRSVYTLISGRMEQKFEKMTIFLEGKEALLVELLDEIKDIITEGQDVSFE